MKKLIITCFTVASAALIIFSTFSPSDSRSRTIVPSARSGGPAGGPDNGNSCALAACHGGVAGYAAPFARTGWITSDIPGGVYVPGATYNITVTNYSKGYKHGFEASCQTAAACVGTLIANDSTQLLVAGTNQWICHLDTSSALQRVPQVIPCQKGFMGTGGSHFNQKSWTFQWTAPTAGTGAVTFYVATLAANGNGSDNAVAYDQTRWAGDSVFTSSLALTEATSNFSSVVSPCNGSNGSATVNANFGTGPYTYLWTPSAQTTSAATGLAAGNYTVNITDALSANMNLHLTLQNKVRAQLNTPAAGGSVNPPCPGVATTYSVLPNAGTAPYTYLWSTGQTTANATGLVPAQYTVTVSDASACSTNYIFNATDRPVLQAWFYNWQDSNVTCTGGSNGYAKVQRQYNTTGSLLSYSWSNGKTTQAVTGLTAGVYTASVVATTTVVGCSTATSTATVTITEPAAPLTATLSAQNNGCNGANNGTATAAGAGGTAPYYYSWNNGQTTANATGLAPGSYTCTVTCRGTYATSQDTPPKTLPVSAVGWCSTTTTVTIVNPAALTATITPTNVLCYGGNGSATVAAGGGTGAYSYAWSSTPIQTTANATNLAVGSYTVLVVDANSCTQTSTVSITQPSAALTATITPTNVLCYGGNGSATVAVGGGTGAYAYSWSSGSSTSAATLAAGSYTVTVTDANSCTKTVSVTITQPTAVTATASVTTNVSCHGGNDGSAAVTAGGGTPAYTYLWSNGSPNASAGGLTAGGYTVTVTDANGCTKTSTVTVTQPAALTTSVTIVTPICGNSTGSITEAPAGGTAPYLYSWNTTPVQTTAVATGLTGTPTQTLTATITDAHGCTLASTSTITCIQAVVENTIESDLNVYPNPNLGEFDMTLNSIVSSDYTIELTNVLGQVIYREALTNFSGKYSKHFDVKGFGGGIYLMNVRGKENQVLRKVIVY